MPAPDSSALALTVACSRFTRRAVRGADVGVSSVTWRIISSLDRFGQMRLSEIAAFEQVSRPTATAAIQRLEEEGLVTRRPDPDDSRSSLVFLTDQGRTRLDAWRSRLAEVVEDLLVDLDADERATLARAADILGRVVDAAPPA